MAKHRAFYSFHYERDSWRASTVREIGAIEGNKPVPDNDWETVWKGGDTAIEKWIADQMKGRSCTVVLVGRDTADREWINYEIIKSWNDGMGVVGIHIHGLKNQDREISEKGNNPFDSIGKLSSIVRCYNPAGSNSKERYGCIERNLGRVVAQAIKIRKENNFTLDFVN